jgi:hypothetical protein
VSGHDANRRKLSFGIAQSSQKITWFVLKSGQTVCIVARIPKGGLIRLRLNYHTEKEKRPLSN